jgi:hypothetical protein
MDTTTAQEPRPTLRPAQQRVLDASRRIDDLHRLLEEMDAHARANPMRVTFPAEQQFDDPSTIAPRVEWGGTHSTQRLNEARMLTSEVIHHLRTALEYLAFQLVWLDTGNPHMKSGFPMCKKSQEWEATLKRQVPGLTPAHQRVIKKLQPFRHCRWVTRLQELSNQDKHRYVLTMNTLLGGRFTWSPKDAHRDPADPSRCRIDLPSSEPLRVEIQGGGDVIEVLTWISRETAELLNSLVSDFSETNQILYRA